MSVYKRYTLSLEAPTWAASVPLLGWLSPYVQHMEFVGNYLPNTIQLELLSQPIFQHVVPERMVQSALLQAWAQKI